MKYIEGTNVKITDGFWKAKQELNRNTTIHSVWNRFSDTGRIAAFNFDWKEGMENKPHIFWDSDVAKWMEGAAYLIAEKYDADLEAKVEGLIDKIEENQEDTGYFNIYFTVCEPDKRFTGRSLHELYCAGHLMEAAVAYYKATGKDRFLKCMEKYADYIYKVFVEEKSAKFVTPGHEEIELALIRMYHTTKNKKYLDLAEFFIEQRGNNSVDFPVTNDALEKNNKYAQSHLPARKQRTAEGHAVRACYWYKAMADLAYEKNDTELADACRDIFNDIITKKMYITGGIGASHFGEAFTVDYDLPNETAYNETCASIAMIFFAKSMMKLENNTVYADIIEKELYNGMLAGLSLDGKGFFYENPLEINLKNHTRHTSVLTKDRLPITQRKEVFDCSCCPPNINRTFASINEYIYGVDGETLYVNQFMSSEGDFEGVSVKQTTNYPLNGNVELSFENAKTVKIRIPCWCDEYTVSGEYKVEDNYITIENPKDVKINFVMKPVLMQSNPGVGSNVDKVALMYGPVVYCAESVDNIENLYSLYINKDVKAELAYNELYGMNEIVADGFVSKPANALYSKYADNLEETKIKLIPYSCFANRGESSMLVWLNVK